MQEKNTLFEKLYNPQYAKTAIKELKKTEAFARTVGQARNMFDRYHMYENKTKTLSKYSSAKRREVEWNKSLEKRVKKKTTTMNQGGLNK